MRRRGAISPVASYGKILVKALTEKYGRGFDASNLYRYLAFFKRFKILDTVCPKSGMCLGWSHYRVLLQVEDDLALRWYLDEARKIVREIVRVMREISSVSSMSLRVTLTPQLQNWRMC